jgi:hypothetical protein
MRIQIAYALIALTALVIFVLIARSRSRKKLRARKHLRIDIISGNGQQGSRAGIDIGSGQP